MEAYSEVYAIVRSVDGDTVVVEIEQSGCGRCQEPGGCGGQKLTQAFCSGPRHYRIGANVHKRVGDRVRLAMPVQVIRKSANLAYVFPLIGLLLGAMLGMFLAGDLAAIAGGGWGVLLAWWFGRRHARVSQLEALAQPRLLD